MGESSVGDIRYLGVHPGVVIGPQGTLGQSRRVPWGGGSVSMSMVIEDRGWGYRVPSASSVSVTECGHSGPRLG